MGFYYISIFSLMLLGVIYTALAFAFWGVARFTRGMPGRKVLLTIVGVVFLIGPVAEELWIAWNFGQACKEAGTFIYKKVEVDGFYDDTRSTHVGEPTSQAVESFNKSGYRFLEMKGPNGRVVHLEKIDDRWKATLLDVPTARYHFRDLDPMNGTDWSYKVLRSGSSLVFDAQTKEDVARYISFSRRPPWFYVNPGLGAPGFGCDAPNRWPDTKGTGLIYRVALVPVAAKQ